MGVEEIYEYLKENEGFHSAAEITLELDLNRKTIDRALGIVTRYEDITCQFLQLERKAIQGRVGLKTKRTWVYAHVNQIKNKGDEYHETNR